LTSEIEDSAKKVERSAELAAQLARLGEKLAEFEKEAMSKKNVESFREEVTAMVRDTQCTMLKNNTLPDAQRFQEFADSAKQDESAKGPKYEIMGHPLSLTVKGTQSAIVELTDRIQARKGLVQLQSYALKQSNGGNNLTTLDIGLLLLDLVKPKEGNN